MLITAIGGGDKSAAMRATLDSLPTQESNVLIVPSACSTPNSFGNKVNALQSFFSELGVSTELLHEFEKPPTENEMAHKIGSAALIYTIGGNTPYMMDFLNGNGVSKPLKQALLNGKPHAGTSAGALLPFTLAHSNPSPRPQEEDWDFRFIPTLGVIPEVVATAHANQHDKTPTSERPDSRMDHLAANMPEGLTGIAIDNGAALMLHGSSVEVITIAPRAGVYRLTTDQPPERLESGERL